jgi:hypothetical protein
MEPIPARAVIDARNLIGQAGDHSMGEVEFTCAGIRAAMLDYGFDVTDVTVGLALARHQKGVLARIHAENAAFRAALQKEGASILEGELRHEDGVVKEKMVDVHCALEVARLAHEWPDTEGRAILLFSRDVDLLPAAKYATDRGVKTYVVSSDGDYRRAQHRLLLTPASYRMLSESDEPLAGEESTVAAFLVDPGPHEWTVREEVVLQGVRGNWLSHGSGIRGFTTNGDTNPLEGATVTLIAADVIFQGAHPVVFCTADVPHEGERPWLVQTEVLRRKDATTIEIDLGGSAAKARCAVGIAEQGQSVLVRVNDHGGLYAQQARARLVGPLALPTPQEVEDGRLTVGRPIPVRIEHTAGGQPVTARTVAGQRVRVFVANGDQPRIGHWYAAVPTALSGSGSRSGPVLTVVSTELSGSHKR